MEELILKALPELRAITFHSDGRVISKTGGRAKFPKKLYSGSGKTTSEKIVSSLLKLLNENK